MGEKGLVIAIDGVVASGKGTLAELLSKKLGYLHIDSGALYRAITYYVMQHNISVDDPEVVIQSLSHISLSFKFNSDLGKNEMWENGVNIEKDIRLVGVSQLVPRIAAIPEVRHFVTEIQRAHVVEGGIVVDGRDVGTIVLPEADLKIFLIADASVRAERRHKEFLERGQNISFEEVLADITNRDHLDMTREVSPLVQAKDAILVDSTHMTIPEVVEYVYNLAIEKPKS